MACLGGVDRLVVDELDPRDEPFECGGRVDHHVCGVDAAGSGDRLVGGDVDAVLPGQIADRVVAGEAQRLAHLAGREALLREVFEEVGLLRAGPRSRLGGLLHLADDVGLREIALRLGRTDRGLELGWRGGRQLHDPDSIAVQLGRVGEVRWPGLGGKAVVNTICSYCGLTALVVSLLGTPLAARANGPVLLALADRPGEGVLRTTHHLVGVFLDVLRKAEFLGPGLCSRDVRLGRSDFGGAGGFDGGR